MHDGTIELRAGGHIFTHWTSIEASRGIEQISGTFDLRVTTDFIGARLLPIRPGDACQARLGGELAFTGWVDTVEPDYTDTTHEIGVSGRDKTGDLVDCSAVHKSGQWINQKLEAIARDLLKSFSIKVIVETDTGKAFPTWNIQEGESVFECLERAARMRAVLLISDQQGNLVITRAGKTRAPVELVEGENILSASANWSWKERHSSYTVKGQGRRDDDDADEQVVHGQARVTDSVINRYRPLIVLAEDQGQTATLTDRANWEKSVRMGRGARGTVTVHGWHHANGLWLPNTVVPVHSPLLALDADMLIVRCVYTLDARGTRTQLTISRPEAFDLVDGVGRSRLDRKLHGKGRRDKKKRDDDDDNAWSLT